MINVGYVQRIVEEIVPSLSGIRSLGMIIQHELEMNAVFFRRVFSLPNQTYFDVMNGTGAVSFSNDAKYLATLSHQSPQVRYIF